LITKRIRSSNCPWFNNHIKALISARDKAYKNWKKYKIDFLLNNYKMLRNRTVLAIRKSKENYANRKLDTRLRTKVLWKNLKTLGVCSSTSSNCTEDPDFLNRKFLSHNRTHNE